TWASQPHHHGAQRMTTNVKEYPQDVLAAQPAGYWTGEAYRVIVGRIRAELGVDGLTQPHWWTLNHVGGAPGEWSRATLVERLRPFVDLGSDLGIDLDGVLDDLVDRGWLREADGADLTLTDAGEAGRQRAWHRLTPVLDQTHRGIEPAEYVAALNVLRRMIANLGGNSDLP
nr:MarR family winged helix-turn-helix transcriptional regulator [Micromonospora sp. DSM 115978]